MRQLFQFICTGCRTGMVIVMTYQPEGNYFDKYNSKNIVVKKIMNGFFSDMADLLKGLDYTTVLDGGCGEGHVADFIYHQKSSLEIEAFDISAKVVEEAANRYPNIKFATGSVYEIDRPDNAYDLVVSCEVLEHLESPEYAIKELLRVTNKFLLLSVPREPIWRVLNMARGKYWKNFGNTPGHIQHWSKRGFADFVAQHIGGGGGVKLEARYPGQ